MLLKVGGGGGERSRQRRRFRLSDRNRYQTCTRWLDATFEFSENLTRALEATRSAGDSYLAGKTQLSREIATQWNGEHDSVAATVRLLGYGEFSPPQLAYSSPIPSCDGALNLASKLRFDALPVCPSIGTKIGVHNALNAIRAARISPDSDTLDADLVAAFIADTAKMTPMSGSQRNLTAGQVLATLQITKFDIALAKTYLCAEAAAFGKTFSPAGQVNGIDRVQGTGVPLVAPPPEAVAAHFLGAMDTGTMVTVEDEAYAKAGAIRTLDQMKLINAALAETPEVGTYLHPKLLESLSDAGKLLEAGVGTYRLEYRVGEYSDLGEGHVTAVRVQVHGARPEERFVAVHGMGALKCVTIGNVDGADCVPEDYAIPFNGPRTAVDSRMRDLTGETITETILSAPRYPDGTAGAITEREAIYVLREEARGWVVMGGLIPKPGSQLVDGWTRVAIEAAGGWLKSAVGGIATPSSTDCSKPEVTCAGLSASLWPPLESEINGQPTDRGYEQSYLHYLQMARGAADEADRRGLELLMSGLEMDKRAEKGRQDEMDLCGVAAGTDSSGGCGAEGGETIPFATLGDRQACLWDVNGSRCQCPTLLTDDMCPVLCPLQVPKGEAFEDAEGLKERCGQLLGAVVAKYGAIPGATIDPIPVFETLGFAKSQDVQQPSACKVFDELRYDDTLSTEERVKRIEQLAAVWDIRSTGDVAKVLAYEEHFFDNYVLRHDNRVVFDTRRRSRRSPNAEAFSPCNPVGPDDQTGSTFWENHIACHVAGQDCANPSVGKDGCSSGQLMDFSMDTEPAALRERWKWGFGHLRRSVATLGVITGELDGMMHLARLHYATKQGPKFNGTTPYGGPVHHKLKGGTTCSHDPNGELPTWVRVCDPWEDNDGDLSYCVFAKRAQYGDNNIATELGHPVNVNGFLRNAIPDGTNWSYPMHTPSDPELPPLPFPAAVDPQFVYCSAPDPDAGAGPWDEEAEIWDGRSSGFIGSSRAMPAEFNVPPETYREALSEMWQYPDGSVCNPDPSRPNKSIIWRAFCTRPRHEEVTSTVVFLQRGELSSDANKAFVNGEELAKWIWASPTKLHFSQYLFDQSVRSVMAGTRPPFQYPLTPWNIMDAMELACHAANVRRSAAMDCKAIDPELISKSNLTMTEVTALVDCYGNWMKEIAGKTIVGPLPAEVVAAAKSNSPLSGMTGLGGAYLDAMVAQYTALSEIAIDFDHMGDRYVRLALLLRELNSIDRKESAEVERAHASQLAAGFQTSAQNVQMMASAIDGGPTTGPKMALAAEAMVYNLLALQHTLVSISAGLNSTQEDLYQQRLHVLGSAIGEVSQARDSARALSRHINDLIAASAQLETTRLKADQARAVVTFQDFVHGQPVYVNTVMRRTYNTNLLRYEAALARAKKLAFVARRAIELRFGVDLSTMDAPMTLVDAPKDWAADVCTMKGIDYNEIRKGKKDSDEFSFGGPVPAGDHFADQFIGDYVTRLEDFVTSYPFDYPLKDGDDIAVLSLAEDIYRLTAPCVKPSVNLLYYSTEFDKRDTEVLEDETRGWFVTDCETGSEAMGWNACVAATQVAGPEPVLHPDAGVTIPLLPEGAVAYRLGNRPCRSVGEESNDLVSASCPDGVGVRASGALTQRLPPLVAAAYQFSLYVAGDPDAAAYEGDNEAAVRVVRERDDFEVARQSGVPDQWFRFNLPFFADQGDRYRVEILPSTEDVPLDMDPDAGSGQWPGLLIAAAQVEQVEELSSGAAEPSSWEYTDLRQTVPQVVCHERVGPELRKRFERRCMQVCPDGIKDSCQESGDPTELGLPVCFYEATFGIGLEDIEAGRLIPSGQIAIGNFNFRHHQVGINLVGTGVTSCDSVQGASCYGNGFGQYALIHSGDTRIRNWEGGALQVHMDPGFIEHGKGLAAELTITNPPSSGDMSVLEPFMKSEFKGRPLQGMYTIRIWDTPTLQWHHVEDVQLVWKYHYWTRFSH